MFHKHRAIWVSVIVAVLVLGSAGAVMTASAANDNIIYAAYQKVTGNLRIISDPSEARPSEEVISWNKVGPPGPQGPAGPQGPQGQAGPPGSAGPGAVVLTFAENVVVQPGARFNAPPQDVKSFSRFKLYARLTPAPEANPGPGVQPAARVTVREGAMVTPGEGSYHTVIRIPEEGVPPTYWEWNAPTTGGTPAPVRWTNASSFEGLFSKLNISVDNTEAAPVTISLYLVAAAD